MYQIQLFEILHAGSDLRRHVDETAVAATYQYSLSIKPRKSASRCSWQKVETWGGQIFKNVIDIPYSMPYDKYYTTTHKNQLTHQIISMRTKVFKDTAVLRTRCSLTPKFYPVEKFSSCRRIFVQNYKICDWNFISEKSGRGKVEIFSTHINAVGNLQRSVRKLQIP